jgi:predicted nucleic acid-binding protein
VALRAYYLADKSALARFPIATVSQACGRYSRTAGSQPARMVDLEILYSSRGLTDYEASLDERRALDSAPITPEVMATAVELQHALARRGHHRVPIPDLVISAAARAAGLVVLHYDADFERITEVGGARHEWVVPPGTI